MKKRLKKRIAAVALAMSIVLSGCGYKYGTYELSTESFGESAWEHAAGMLFSDSENGPQLTVEDIQAMNNNNAIITYGDQGQVTSIVGRISDKKINDVYDYEEVLSTVKGLATLLQFNNGCEFFADYGEKDKFGNVYYTYRQRMGTFTVPYSMLKLVVGTDGYVCGLSSSFTPNLVVEEEFDEANKITAAEAEQIVSANCAGLGMEIVPGATQEMVLNYNSYLFNGYVVYTNNPYMNQGADMPYLEHMVTALGEYVTSNPADSTSEASAEANFDEAQYFANLTPVDYTTDLVFADGHTQTVTITISKNESDGLYYMADPNRKIIFVDQWTYEHGSGNKYDFKTSTTGDDWDNDFVAAMYNYSRVYDFYKERGIEGPDGFGIPILIMADTKEMTEDGRIIDLDNACFHGYVDGWATFYISKANYYSYCIDVIGHEYTHAVRAGSMANRSPYTNEVGAIHESYSDIMGNLIQDIVEGDEPTWMVGENNYRGADRTMTDPNKNHQPSFVGDVWYTPVTGVPGSYNDGGGVHINSSLPNLVAAKMKMGGMDANTEFDLWWISMEFLSPLGNYTELEAALCFAARIIGIPEYEATIHSIFAELGMSGTAESRDAYAQTVTRQGAGRVQFKVNGNVENVCLALNILECSNGEAEWVSLVGGYSDGTVSVMLPAGDYAFILGIQNVSNGNTARVQYKDGHWGTDGLSAVSVGDGAVVELNGIDLD